MEKGMVSKLVSLSPDPDSDLKARSSGGSVEEKLYSNEG